MTAPWGCRTVDTTNIYYALGIVTFTNAFGVHLTPPAVSLILVGSNAEGGRQMR